MRLLRFVSNLNNAHFRAMEQSPVTDEDIKLLLNDALIDSIDDRRIYMMGIDASYSHEGFTKYRSKNL